MVGTVRKEYDFSKARRNPYARRLKRQVTIRLDEETIRYFNGLAAETGIPYQTLINLYLRSEEHTSELQSRLHLVCRLLLEKKKKKHCQDHRNPTVRNTQSLI